MHIGIISMQRINNYGSFLQSYALKSVLEKMGHTVSFVDIECKNNQVNADSGNKLSSIIKKVKYVDRYLVKRVLYSKRNKEMDQMFLRVRKKYFDMDPYQEDCSAKECDAVAIGSDEIFNCAPDSQWGITAQRFGDIPGVTTFSYAASCGFTSLDDISSEDRDVIKNSLAKMKMISVRDENTAKFAENFCHHSVEQNLDPVLIYDFDAELADAEKTGVPAEPYMVVYAYHNRINSAAEIKAIKEYAKRNGLRTIAIGGSLPWCDDFVVLEPFQVLAYFKHARCIVTDTFHGSVMASKYNKSFAVLVRDSNKNKIGDLLERIDIRNHEVTNINKLESVLNQSCDYSNTNQIIAEGKRCAMNYLHKATT